MTEEFDPLDIYLSQSAGVTKAVTSQLTKNMGHYLFCPACRKFTRHEITFDKVRVELNLACRTCKDSEVYVLTVNGWMPTKLREVFKRYARKRGREILSAPSTQ